MRRGIKKCLFAIALVLTSPLIVVAWLEKSLTSQTRWFVSLSQLLSLVPGHTGSYLRAAYCFAILDQCDWEVYIGFGTYFSCRAARLGPNVSMGGYCVIGTATIEAGTLLASRVSIPSGKRQHFDDEMNIRAEPTFDRVTIGRGCWIGEGATILADIGDSSVVSAGAVVVEAMPADTIIGGNPAKVIKRRNKT